eukprot:6174042-Pleurochrysis_carterae.AAC.5
MRAGLIQRTKGRHLKYLSHRLQESTEICRSAPTSGEHFVTAVSKEAEKSKVRRAEAENRRLDKQHMRERAHVGQMSIHKCLQFYVHAHDRARTPRARKGAESGEIYTSVIKKG